jgi:uncharacterized RDD family membrane protein YckC
VSDADAALRGDIPATLGQRTLARAIDLVIISSVVIALGGAMTTNDSGQPEIPRWVVLAVALCYLAYEATMVAMSGATVGKRATRIMIVSIQNGRRPVWIQAVLRALVPIAGWLVVPGFGLLVLMIVYLTAIFDRDFGRGLPDRLAGTVVVQRRNDDDELS